MIKIYFNLEFSQDFEIEMSEKEYAVFSSMDFLEKEKNLINKNNSNLVGIESYKKEKDKK